MSKLAFAPRSMFLFLAIIVLFLASLACGGSFTGAEEDAAEPVAPIATMPQPTETLGYYPPPSLPPTTVPALPERRFLTLEYPPRIRAGDSDVVRLTLEVDDLGNITPTVEIEGHAVAGKVVEIPNLYETHHVIAEARYDLAGVEVRPSELISSPISQGQTAVFYWSLRPKEVGTYRGTVWLYLRYVDKSTGEESRKTVSAQVVQIESVNLLGLSPTLARAVGLVGTVLGSVLGFPFFEDLVKFFMRKLGIKT